MPAPFVQIHFLTSYPSALLNRDDAGFAKRVPFGGVSRTRISSQCLKRHWRTFEGEGALRDLDVPMSIRSRATFEEYVYQPLLEGGVADALARAATAAMMEAVLGKSKKAKASDDDKGLQTGQVTVLGRAEVDYLLRIAREVCAEIQDAKQVEAALKDRLGREGKKNLEAMKAAAGLDAALFGRMVTSDILARGDAAVHVAHAFTVHEEASESDYFSAVDDLAKASDELGSGHIGSVELTSGLYYGYAVVDLPLLVSNLQACKREDWLKADRTLAASVVLRLVRLLATVSPGAKLGSTAPYAYAHLVMVEAGRAQPRTLANAFLNPVKARPDLLTATYQALAGYLGDVDQAYGRPERRFLALGPADLLAPVAPRVPSLDELAGWAGAQVRED